MSNLQIRVRGGVARRTLQRAVVALGAAVGVMSWSTGDANAAIVNQPIAWTQFATNDGGTADVNNGAVSTIGAPNTNMQWAHDKNAAKISGSVVDHVNNRVYVSTNVGLDRGNVTILNATTGAVIQKINTTGGVSQMVVAGDGKVYGVVNQRSGTTNEASGQAYRIVRFNTPDQNSYSVGTIWQPSDIGASSTSTPIVGLGLNPANNNPIWTLSGVSTAGKNASGWEYVTSTSTPTQRTVGNTGFSLNRGGYANATAVGLTAGGKPVVGYYSNASNNPKADALIFDSTPNPSIIVDGIIPTTSTGFVNASLTASSYSISHNNFWEGFSGGSGSALIAVKNGTNNPGGNTATPGVYADSGTAAFFHALPEGGAFAGGGNYMVGTMTDDGAGNVFYSVIARPDGSYISAGGLGAGKVLQMDSAGTYYDDGVPTILSGRTGSILNSEQVVSISSAPKVGGGLVIFATTLDTTGQYRVYRSPGAIVPEPGTMSVLCLGGLLLAARRRRRSE